MRTAAEGAATPRSIGTASDSNDLREQRKQLASNVSDTTVMGALRAQFNGAAAVEGFPVDEVLVT